MIRASGQVLGLNEILFPLPIIQIMEKLQYSPRPPVVIGLTGKAGHGKDTVAAILHGKYGFKRFAFADRIKETCAVMYNIPLSSFHSRELKEKKVDRYGLTPREMCQVVGTDIVRNHINKDFWLNSIKYEIEDIVDESKSKSMFKSITNVVISDLRFDNEAEMIKNINDAAAIIVHVDASLRLRSEEKVTGSNHESENGIHRGLIDIYVDNNGTLDDLYKEIDIKLPFLPSLKNF